MDNSPKQGISASPDILAFFWVKMLALGTLEEWLSGRRHHTRNVAYGKLYRGFKSHLFRKVKTTGFASPKVRGNVLASCEVLQKILPREFARLRQR